MLCDKAMEEGERCRGAGLEEEEGQVVGRVNQDKVPTYLRWTVKKVRQWRGGRGRGNRDLGAARLDAERSTSRLTMLLDLCQTNPQNHQNA